MPLETRWHLPKLGRCAFPGVALAVTLSCAGLWWLGEAQRWEFDRAAITSGEWWRLVTAHFVHYGADHARGDILAFALWAGALEALSRRWLVVTLAWSTSAIGLGVLIGRPDVEHYAGLSGVLLTLVVVLVAVVAARARGAGLHGVGILAAVTGGLVLIKTSVEFARGQALLAPDLGEGVRLLPEAHAFGALVGLGIAWRVMALSEPWDWAKVRPR